MASYSDGCVGLRIHCQHISIRVKFHTTSYVVTYFYRGLRLVLNTLIFLPTRGDIRIAVLQFDTPSSIVRRRWGIYRTGGCFSP